MSRVEWTLTATLLVDIFPVKYLVVKGHRAHQLPTQAHGPTPWLESMCDPACRRTSSVDPYRGRTPLAICQHEE